VLPAIVRAVACRSLQPVLVRHAGASVARSSQIL
jgi:hypothetical protein